MKNYFRKNEDGTETQINHTQFIHACRKYGLPTCLRNKYIAAWDFILQNQENPAVKRFLEHYSIKEA